MINRNSSFYNGYEFIKILGTGSFSVVMLVKRNKDEQLFALKQISLQKLSQSQKNAALTQIRILASIQSPYIIGYQDSFYSSENNCICIVMQFAEDGDLSMYIDKCINYSGVIMGLPQEFIWTTTINLLEGLNVLHQHNIVHRDLKSSNIYFNEKQAKLGDFNVSNISDGQLFKTKTGTPYYTAPQIWKGQLYTKSCDIWSLGCIIYEMCALQPPFKSNNMPQLFVKVVKGVYSTLPSHYSQQLRTIVRMCLNIDPNQRPSTRELLSNQLIRKKRQFLKDIQTKQSKVKLIGPLKCPKGNLFLNNLLDKIDKNNYQEEEQIFYRKQNKKKCVQFRYSEADREFSQEKERKQFCIRIKKKGGHQSKSSHKPTHSFKGSDCGSMKHIVDKQKFKTLERRDTHLRSRSKFEARKQNKKHIFKSVKHIEDDEEPVKKPCPIQFRVKSCKKFLQEHHYQNKQNDF